MFASVDVAKEEEGDNGRANNNLCKKTRIRLR